MQLCDLVVCDGVVPTQGPLDSRGLVYLKQSKLQDALADFDAALAKHQKAAASLYARGVVKNRLGDSLGSKADFAAKAINGAVVKEYAEYGIGP